jgi:hypothetical protein
LQKMKYIGKCYTPSNQIIEKEVEASDEITARELLVIQGYAVLSLRAGQGVGAISKNYSGKFSLLLFSHELQALLRAGLSLIEAIETLHEKEYRPGVKAISERVLKALFEGTSLSSALDQQPQHFPTLFVAMIRASEKTGDLASTLGWGIDGLSQISRCGTTLEQDGIMNGVTYTATDRFCIDGQRLIATTDTYNTTTKQYSSTSAYGANGTEYRTESANFAKIISYGQAGNGPAYFKVWTKSGQVIEYGNTADSAIEAQGKPTIHTWGVNKISDTKGNYITVSYTEDNANGEAYVQKIDYTGNASSTPILAPYANVQFTYESRPDTTTVYQAGSVLKTTKRLMNIQAYNGATLIKSYKLSYSNTGAYHTNTSNAADGTLLASVQECDGSATPVCKQATSLTWVPGTVSNGIFGSVQTWGLPSGALILASGDVNGDGMADVIYSTGSNPLTLTLGISNGTSFVNMGVVGTQKIACVYSEAYTFCKQFPIPWVYLADVNGDGKADLINNNTVRLSTGSGFGTAQNWGITNILAVGDVNGDGRSDVIYLTPGTTSTLSLAFSSGSAFIDQGSQGIQFSAYESWKESDPCVQIDMPWLVLVDVDGDGKSDLVNKNTVNLSVGSGFGAAQNWEVSNIIAAGDINGDGKSDVIYWTGVNNSPFGLAVSNGIKFSDLGAIGAPKSMFSVSAPSDIGGYCTLYNFPHLQLVDVNGDGAAGDLIDQNTLSVDRSNIRLELITNADQLKSVRSGGFVSNVVYNKLSAGGLYVADTTSAYPVRDIAISYPIYVVSSSSVSDGLGGVVTTNYQYGGLKTHLRGRGSLGFRYVKESSPDSGLGVTTFYRQDFPFIGLPSQVEKRRLSDNALLSVVQNTYANTDLTTGTMLSKFPYLSQSVEQAYELDGSLVSTTTTRNQYDGYGNVTSVSVDDWVGNTKTTTSTYNNDVGNWLLGRLIRSTVTSMTP